MIRRTLAGATLSALWTISTCVPALAAEIAMTVKGGIGPRAETASRIELCSELPSVTSELVQRFASQLYPDRTPPTVVEGDKTPSSGTIYAYLGGKIASLDLRRCAERWAAAEQGATIRRTIEAAHGRLGTPIDRDYLPKNYPKTWSAIGAETVSLYHYDSKWSLVAFVSTKDDAIARREFLRALFGLTYEYCTKYCDQILNRIK